MDIFWQATRTVMDVPLRAISTVMEVLLQAVRTVIHILHQRSFRSVIDLPLHSFCTVIDVLLCFVVQLLMFPCAPSIQLVWFGFNRGHYEVSTGSSVEAMSIPLTRSLL